MDTDNEVALSRGCANDGACSSAPPCAPHRWPPAAPKSGGIAQCQGSERDYARRKVCMTRERCGSGGEEHKVGLQPCCLRGCLCFTVQHLHKVGKPAYKDQAFHDPPIVGFTSKHKCIAGKTFCLGQRKLPHIKIWSTKDLIR